MSTKFSGLFELARAADDRNVTAFRVAGGRRAISVKTSLGDIVISEDRWCTCVEPLINARLDPLVKMHNGRWTEGAVGRNDLDKNLDHYEEFVLAAGIPVPTAVLSGFGAVVKELASLIRDFSLRGLSLAIDLLVAIEKKGEATMADILLFEEAKAWDGFNSLEMGTIDRLLRPVRDSQAAMTFRSIWLRWTNLIKVVKIPKQIEKAELALVGWEVAYG
jgi:hypothetical protein